MDADFAEAAGFKAPLRSDGVSLIPSLTGKGKQAPSNIYVEYVHPSRTSEYKEFEPGRRGIKRGQMQMLRVGDIVGVRYEIKSARDDFKIYNILKDPKQANDLAKSEPYLQALMKDKILQMRKPDEEAERPYDEAFVPAVDIKKAKKGLVKKAFAVNEHWIPQTALLKPIAKTKVAAPNATIEKGNLVVFEGYINVPTDGQYTFYLSTGSKAFLRIHDISVIDEDFNYTAGEEKTAVMKLKAGLHPIKLHHFKLSNSTGTTQLKLSWSTSGKGKEAIPETAFLN
ncbi:hypothetical protein A5893_16855 [Pedobacter psychrophilus]|uniref:PA14 domain-containing protein n=1 Tax=Pedobacter psychrophilus TaxID=1826909 RepID=A0A179DA07_9SPHI|nr:PA14 domain-containing protein [Pedobacter psychrophilus]OAQ37881.1 hypothetical protein A5893_16855 [Pedobacter psychrophilus]